MNPPNVVRPARKSRGNLVPQAGELSSMEDGIESNDENTPTTPDTTKTDQAIIYDSAEEDEYNNHMEDDDEEEDESEEEVVDTKITLRNTRSREKLRSIAPNSTKDTPNIETRKQQLASIRFSGIFNKPRTTDSEDEDEENSGTDEVIGSVIFDSEEEHEEDNQKFAENFKKAKPKKTEEPSKKKQKVDNTEPKKSDKNDKNEPEALESHVISIDPHSILFKFICSCATSPEVRTMLKNDFEDEKLVISRKKYNLKSSTRKGRISEAETKMIKKYMDAVASCRLMRHTIPLSKFNNTKSFDEDKIYTWDDDSSENEINPTNVKHFIATCLGRSFELVQNYWKKEERKHDRFPVFLEQMRYHFEVQQPLDSAHSVQDQDEEIYEIYESIVHLLQKYQHLVNLRREQKSKGRNPDANMMLQYDEIVKKLGEHFGRLDDYQKAYNEELHETLFMVAVK